MWSKTSNRTSNNDLASRRQNPLGHLISFILCRAQAPTKTFLWEREGRRLIPIVNPFVPANRGLVHALRREMVQCLGHGQDNTFARVSGAARGSVGCIQLCCSCGFQQHSYQHHVDRPVLVIEHWGHVLLVHIWHRIHGQCHARRHRAHAQGR